MRPILALALVCLGLTLAIEHARTLFPQATGDGVLADRALEILVGAKGPLLPAARLGGGRERIGELIQLGDRTLVGACASGLRAAFLARGGELRSERCFDVAHSEGDLRALHDALEEAEPGELLVLASSGRLEPTAAGRSTELERVLATLGARAHPGATTPESWAVIAVRLAQGWVPLAEGYSRDSGVALAFVLAPDFERYAGFRGDFVEVRAGAQSEIFLDQELVHASSRSEGIALAPGGTVLGRPLDGIAMPPRQTAEGEALPARVSWSGVALGPGSGLLAWVGLADEANAGSDGVVFEVRIDGELVHAQPVVPGTPWKVLQIDLRRFAGRSVELELAVDPRAGAAGDAALWGRPVLVHGYERSPLEALGDER